MGPYSHVVHNGYVVVPDSRSILRAHGFDLPNLTEYLLFPKGFFYQLMQQYIINSTTVSMLKRRIMLNSFKSNT